MKPKIDWEQIWVDFACKGECGLFITDEKLIRKLVEAELKRKKPKVRKRLKKSK